MTLITAGGTSLNQECKRYLTAHQDGRTAECTTKKRDTVLAVHCNQPLLWTWHLTDIAMMTLFRTVLKWIQRFFWFFDFFSMHVCLYCGLHPCFIWNIPCTSIYKWASLTLHFFLVVFFYTGWYLLICIAMLT